MLVYVCCSGFADLAVEVSRTDPASVGIFNAENCKGDWEDTVSGKRDVD